MIPCARWCSKIHQNHCYNWQSLVKTGGIHWLHSSEVVYYRISETPAWGWQTSGIHPDPCSSTAAALGQVGTLQCSKWYWKATEKSGSHPNSFPSMKNLLACSPKLCCQLPPLLAFSVVTTTIKQGNKSISSLYPTVKRRSSHGKCKHCSG